MSAMTGIKKSNLSKKPWNSGNSSEKHLEGDGKKEAALSKKLPAAHPIRSKMNRNAGMKTIAPIHSNTLLTAPLVALAISQMIIPDAPDIKHTINIFPNSDCSPCPLISLLIQLFLEQTDQSAVLV